MALFSRLNQRAITWDKIFGDGGPSVTTASGKRVSQHDAMKLSAVYACITLIADAVSGMPPEAFKERQDGSRDPAPVPQWVLTPHQVLLRNEVWHQLLVSALGWGNGYALTIRQPSSGVIKQIHPLDPATVTCEWKDNTQRARVYRIDGGPPLGEEDVLQISGPMLPGQPIGMSVIQYARESVGLGLTLEEYGSRYFSQGSLMRGVIELPDNAKGNSDMMKLMLNEFESHHQGFSKWHRPGLLFGGAKYTPISIPPNDAQFLESREFQAMDIARWFRVPPHRIGIVSKQSSWGSGLAEENTAMLQHTFRPWILRLESALTAYSRPGKEESGVRIRLNDAFLLRGSFKEMVDAWSIAVEKGLATPNEARKAIGLDKIHGGDDLVKGESATAEPAPPEPTSEEVQDEQNS